MTEKPKLALDFDSTLAKTSIVAFDLICGPDHDYSYDDIESWEWLLNKFGTSRALSALWHAWTLRPEEVPPTEESLAKKVARLGELFEVHIVTSDSGHMGIKEGKQGWLGDHGIEYEEYHHVPSEQSKTAYLDYSFFVDDKPYLPAEATNGQTVYLYDQPYNRDARGEYIRVDSLTDVIDHAKQARRPTHV